MVSVNVDSSTLNYGGAFLSHDKIASGSIFFVIQQVCVMMSTANKGNSKMCFLIWMRWHCLQTQDSKFEPCRSEAEHATYQSRRLPTILNLYEWAGKKHFVSLKLKGQSGVRPRDLRLSKQAVLTFAPGLPPSAQSSTHFLFARFAVGASALTYMLVRVADLGGSGGPNNLTLVVPQARKLRVSSPHNSW